MAEQRPHDTVYRSRMIHFSINDMCLIELNCFTLTQVSGSK